MSSTESKRKGFGFIKANPFSSLRKKLSLNTAHLEGGNVLVLPKFDFIQPSPVPSESEDSEDFEPPKKRFLLNGQSPASEIPSTWKEWDFAYQSGLIDMENPPPPPDRLEYSGRTHSNGDYLAPRLDSEKMRQRALDSTGVLEMKKTLPTNPLIPVSQKRNSNPVLQDIVVRAQKTFDAGFTGVNMVDGEYIVFLANVGFEGVEGNPRDATVCAHTLLASSTGSKSVVILDLKKDWRFNQSPNHSGFYASFPIFVEPSFNDSASEPYPIGLMCVMDPKPRKSFTNRERKSLENLAHEAGLEISRSAKERKVEKEEIRTEKQEMWSEAETSYELETLELSDSRNNSITTILPAYSAATAASPENSVLEVDLCPVFSRRGATRRGVLAPQSDSIPPALRKLFTVATSLIAETLGFSFVYFLSVDLNPNTPPSQALSLVSSHNLPTPPPLFDFQQHLDLLSTSSTLLYNSLDFPDNFVPGQFSTGLITKVGISGSGYVLAGYSIDKKKVYDREDFLFFTRFADDLNQHIGKM